MLGEERFELGKLLGLDALEAGGGGRAQPRRAADVTRTQPHGSEDRSAHEV